MRASLNVCLSREHLQRGAEEAQGDVCQHVVLIGCGGERERRIKDEANAAAAAKASTEAQKELTIKKKLWEKYDKEKAKKAKKAAKAEKK